MGIIPLWFLKYPCPPPAKRRSKGDPVSTCQIKFFAKLSFKKAGRKRSGGYAFWPRAKAFLFSSRNFSGTQALMASSQASWGKSK